MTNIPILSICIPTYNRATYLEKSLLSIMQTEEFKNNEIEIVISDNCSTDNTEEVVRKYLSRNNIVYYKNEENIKDLNFPVALERATGLFRKLSNDTIIYKPDSIKYMVHMIEKNADERPMICFMNSNNRVESEVKYSDLNDFIKELGRNITWIPVLGMWKDDVDLLSVMKAHVQTQLAQVPFTIELFCKRESAVIVEKELIEVQSVKKKNISYGLYNVFYTNYLGFIKKYVEKGYLLNDTYNYLKKELLFEFFINWVINFELNRDEFLTSEENLRELIEDEYKKEPYYLEYKRKYFNKYVKSWVKSKVKKLIYPIYKVVHK